MECFRVISVPGGPDNLPTLEEILGLPERTVTPVEEEDLGLIDLFDCLPSLGITIPTLSHLL